MNWMNILIFFGGITLWLFIGYISILVSFKIAKWDIDEAFSNDLVLWASAGGLITTIIFLLIGIIYLLMVVPYKIIFPDKDIF